MIVRGEDGLDEVTLTGKTKVLELKNNTIKEYEIRPEDFGFEACNIEDITAEKIEEKIRITKEILS
jgi:anthranilate phosphoribosyltransferase